MQEDSQSARVPAPLPSSLSTTHTNNTVDDKMPVEHNMHLIESPTIHGHNLLPSLSPVNVNLLFQLNCLKLMSPLMVCPRGGAQIII